MTYLTDREVRMMAEMAALAYLHRKTRDRLMMELTIVAGACVVFFISLVVSIAR
jgi:hypothetical protein